MANASISRAEALGLIVEERSPEIIEAAVQRSVALTTFRRINVGTSTIKFPLLETFPVANWLAADDAVKPTTEMAWSSTSVAVEEIAAIATIPENVLDDSTYDLWGEVRDRIAESIGRALDAACFFGTGAPASFPVGGIFGGAQAAANVVGTSSDEFKALSDAMALVEGDGFDPNHGYAGIQLRGALRSSTDSTGRPLYLPNVTGAQSATDTIYGVPFELRAQRRVGLGQGADDRRRLAVRHHLVVRQDITVKMLDQATVGGVNLAEQDTLGMRVKARFGFTVQAPKGINSGATPYPFAAVGALTQEDQGGAARNESESESARGSRAQSTAK